MQEASLDRGRWPKKKKKKSKLAVEEGAAASSAVEDDFSKVDNNCHDAVGGDVDGFGSRNDGDEEYNL